VTGDVAIYIDDAHLGDHDGTNPFRVVGSAGDPVERTIRLAGRDADEFTLYGPGCGEQCPRSGFRCAANRCDFGVAFSCLRVGRIEGRLVTGAKSYRLTGTCLPVETDPPAPSTSKPVPKTTGTPGSSPSGASRGTGLARDSG
jgi:hypothetical protein